MSPGEWIALVSVIAGVSVSVLGAIVGAIGGLLWWLIRREVSRFEDDLAQTRSVMSRLADAITNLTISLNAQQHEVKSLKEQVNESHRDLWDEVAKLREKHA